jgi:hypothetical protein
MMKKKKKKEKEKELDEVKREKDVSNKKSKKVGVFPLYFV